MKKHIEIEGFDEHEALHDLKHFLPAQAPLKDFVHHNTLHAYQHLEFTEAIQKASKMFGYKVSLSLNDFRNAYKTGKITDQILERVISEKIEGGNASEWKEKMLLKDYKQDEKPRIGSLRKFWKFKFNLDLDSLVHPVLFRILCSYLDQGISIWGFPVKTKSFLTAIREIERKSSVSFFRGKRAKALLLGSPCEIEDLLKMLVGEDKSLYKEYLFDQQFSHQGWSGLVSVIEDLPESLLDTRHISLHDLVVFELLLEIDALDYHFDGKWEPLESRISNYVSMLFDPIQTHELDHVMVLWQEAFEWSYYDEVLNGIKQSIGGVVAEPAKDKSFQAFFCIDDRECSVRRHLEKQDPNCETFGTPGFFGVEFFYQPEKGKFYTKLCPAPVTPKYLIKEMESENKRGVDINFSKHSHNFYSGWLFSQTIGFWSAVKLFANIFRPSMGPAMSSSFNHMYKYSKLTIENRDPSDMENGLQIGFTIPEMALRVGNVLKSIGLVKDFAPVVYIVGHGASTINNPHYSAYDCGACSGRAGSVNARVFSYMANHPQVRAILAEDGLVIPDKTQFVGALHDTTRDEVMFYDEDALSHENFESHTKHEVAFQRALDFNSKERSRRFESIDTNLKAEKIHEQIKTRSVSLFEPRPELNHATNALCIVGKRMLTKKVFLDRRAFMNSYDYEIDPKGEFLIRILNAAAPVCGGINLEYFFSRVDNQKFGAGTKLPHNVMGLVGVANGIDGDLRPGLPSQMVEVHDPVRLLMIVEHFPQVVLDVIKSVPATYEWFENQWVKLVVLNPETSELWKFEKGGFVPYQTLEHDIKHVNSEWDMLESTQENLPVVILN